MLEKAYVAWCWSRSAACPAMSLFIFRHEPFTLVSSVPLLVLRAAVPSLQFFHIPCFLPRMCLFTECDPFFKAQGEAHPSFWLLMEQWSLQYWVFKAHIVSDTFCYVTEDAMYYIFLHLSSKQLKARLICLRCLAQFFMYNKKNVVADERMWKKSPKLGILSFFWRQEGVLVQIYEVYVGFFILQRKKLRFTFNSFSC